MTTQPPMSREIIDLALLFTSVFVGTTIAFLAALVTFTFHTEIRERLVAKDSSSPMNPTNKPRARASTGAPRAAPTQKPRPPPSPRTDPRGSRRTAEQQPGPAVYGLRYSPPPSPPSETETTTLGPNHPTENPAVSRTNGTIWDPHPQYITDWDQPVAVDQQPVDTPPEYRRRPAPGGEHHGTHSPTY